MALELRVHRGHQLRLLSSLLACLSRPERGSRADRKQSACTSKTETARIWALAQAIPHFGEEAASPLIELLAQRKVLGLALGFGAYNYVFFLLLYWLPAYLSSALHIDLLHSFLYTSVPWFVATATDLAIGGFLVDFLVQRGFSQSAVRRTVLIGGTAFGLGILGAAHAHSPSQALIWITVSLSGLAAAAPVAWSLPSFIARRPDVGKVGGIINFSGQVSGIVASILTGYLVSAHHSYASAFAVAAAYLAVGIAGYLFLLGRIEQPRLAPEAA